MYQIYRPYGANLDEEYRVKIMAGTSGTGTTTRHLRTYWDGSEAPRILAALVGATAIVIMGAASLKAEEASTAAPTLETTAPQATATPQAAAAPEATAALEIVAQIPLPRARPVQPGEIALTGVGAIALQYTQFQRAVTEAIGSSLGTPREIRRLLDKLRFSEPQSVAQGWLAHRGLIAANDPAFADGVRRALAQQGPISVMEQLTGRGSFARNLPGANSAVAAVMSQIVLDNDRLSELRAHFLSAAHTFQGNRWGMIEKPTSQQAVDFANVENLGAQTTLTTHVASALEALAPISPALAYAPPLMERVLAYGARHLIATSLETEIQAGDLAPPTQRSTSCLNWAKLNLNQCIAAAHFPSEEAWCTATHAIEDVRACWASVLPTADR